LCLFTYIILYNTEISMVDSVQINRGRRRERRVLQREKRREGNYYHNNKVTTHAK